MQQVPIYILKFGGKAKAWTALVTSKCRKCCHQIWAGTVLISQLFTSFALAADRPEIGARALGMGGAFISSVDDSTGALWNPAGLASLQRGNFIYDLSQGGFSVGYPIHPRLGSVGFSVLDLKGDDRFLIDHPNNPIGTFERGRNQTILSYARTLHANWMIGGNIGYRRAPYHGSRWKQNYDLGLIVKITPNLIFGARGLDIFGVKIPDSKGHILESYDTQFALGATWTPLQHLQLNSVLDATARQFKAGAETGAHGVAFRLGSAIDLRNLEQPFNWSIGLSLSRWGKLIHYAYLAQSDLEYKHLLSVGATFGPFPITETNQSSPRADRPISQSTAQVERRENKRQSVIESGSTAVSPTVKIAKLYDLELELVLAMVRVESNFQPNAISKSGAVGLTQLMSFTGRELGLKVPNYGNPRKPTRNAQTDERFHPRKNLEAGVKYLSRMLKMYDGNHSLAIAAYNAGPGRVKRNVPLMRQTEQHVGRVLKHYYRYKSNPAVKNAALQKLDAALTN